jgi:hypothetical protein
MSELTLFRNANGPEERWTRDRSQPVKPLRVAMAEVGYLLTIPFSIVETIFSAIAKLFSMCLPIGERGHQSMTNWVKSSAFCVGWSSCDALMNLCFKDLIVKEKTARASLAAGNILEVPPARN